MKTEIRHADYLYVINYAAQPPIPESSDQPTLTAGINYLNTNEVPPAERLQNAFLHGIVHEMRNPLTNISLALGELGFKSDDPDYQVYLDIISRSAKRINALVTSLLKPESTDPMTTIGIDSVITEALTFSTDRLQLRNASIYTNFNNDCQVRVDKSKFQIALANLIINAIEAVPMEKGKIRIKTEKIAGKCFVTIADNGPGIKKSDVAKIFSKHFTTKATGTGVGLSVTRSILEDHHAHIDVDTKRGKGTKFIISMDIVTDIE